MLGMTIPDRDGVLAFVHDGMRDDDVRHVLIEGIGIGDAIGKNRIRLPILERCPSMPLPYAIRGCYCPSHAGLTGR